MSIQVSVVVPTYKRPDLLRKCLDALIKQEFPPNAYEIIVVDDAGCEETKSLVMEFVGRTQQPVMMTLPMSGPETDSCPQIRYTVAAETQGPAAARNVGWRMARGEVIAFTDDDCLPAPDWLKEGVEAIQSGWDGVSGQVIVPIPNDPTDYEKNIARLHEAEFVTANCFYRRFALDASGGFDERFTMAWREDADLFFHLLTRSYKLGYAPTAKVIHPVRHAPWGISIHEQQKSVFNALLFKKYPQLYRERIQSRPPIRYYAILFSIIGFLVAFVMGNKYFAWFMAFLWTGLTLQFAFQRLRGTKHTLSHILEMLFTSIAIPPLSIFWRLAGAWRYKVLFF